RSRLVTPGTPVTGAENTPATTTGPAVGASGTTDTGAVMVWPPNEALTVTSIIVIVITGWGMPVTVKAPLFSPSTINNAAGVTLFQSGRSEESRPVTPPAGAGPSRTTLPCATRVVGSLVPIDVG